MIGIGLVAGWAGWSAGDVDADPRVPVAIEATNPSVSAGDTLSYRVSVSCSIGTGCPDTTITITPPVGASGPGEVSQPYPPNVSSVTSNPDGSVTVVMATITAGNSAQLQVNWPTVNYYTEPGPQDVSVTVNSPAMSDPSSASTTNTVVASPNPTINKTGPATAGAGSTFTYVIDVDNRSANPAIPRGALALVDAIVRDVLPTGVEFVSATAGGTYDAATRTVTWPLIDTDPALAGNQFTAPVQYRVTVTIPVGSPAIGSTIINTATVTGTPFGGGTPITRDDTVPTVVGTSTGTVVPTVTKSGELEVTPGQNVAWVVQVGNSPSADAPGNSHAVDVLPAGFDTNHLVAYDQYNPSANPVNPVTVTVTYSDGSTASFPLTTASLVVRRPGVRVTQLAWDTVLNPGQLNVYEIHGQVTADATEPFSNCVEHELSSGTMTVSATGCADPTIRDRVVKAQITKTTSQVPVGPGGTHRWTVSVTNDPYGQNTDAVAPQLVDLLPPELTYVDGSFALAAGQPATCPATSDFVVSVEPDRHDGRDALVATARAGAEIDGARTVCSYTFDTVVNAGVAPGTYGGNAGAADYRGNEISLFDVEGAIYAGEPADVDDLDGDGDTTEHYVSAAEDFAVSEASALLVSKQVRGDQDTDFVGSAETDPSAVATSRPGGTLDYRVVVGNQGNKDLDHVVVYDLLPSPGVPGVTDGRYGDTKPYEWVPTMTGPIATTGAPVSITYSTDSDPCRPEMDATRGSASFYCAGVIDPSFVPAASVSDWSAVRSIRFDFGTTVLSGGESYTFEWTMDVPDVAADGSAFEGGEVTWNKVGTQGRNASGSQDQLLPTEAPWVVSQVEPEPGTTTTSTTSTTVPAGTTTTTSTTTTSTTTTSVAVFPPTTTIPTPGEDTPLPRTGGDSTALVQLGAVLVVAGLVVTRLTARKRPLPR